MKFFLLIVGISTAVLCQKALAQEGPGKDAKSIPARATPADYQAHAQAGAYTVAAEFTGHSIPTPEGIFTTEEYVGVEVALFGPPEARLKLSFQDFSIRINGKKGPSPAQGYVFVFKSLKDPEWEPPAAEAKSKTSIGGGGRGQSDGPPPVVHMPLELERVMDQRVQKASLPEGERTLPEAGLIFFPHHGTNNKGIHSIELIYNGPAGKASLELQP